MAEVVGKAPLRWILIGLAMLILAAASATAAGFAISANSKASKQQAKILALEVAAKQAAALRASEKRTAAARKASECRARIAGTKQGNELLAALRDLASIPQTNLQTYLDGPLSADQRALYEDALGRYRRAEKRFHGYPVPTCVRSDT